MNSSFETGNNSSKARDLSAGMVILNTYEVRALLGRGGMGAVYRVYHRYLQKEMAMKTLYAAQLTSQTWQRFQVEAKAIAKLEHPNIVQIFDMGICEDGQPFYTMELLSGMGLDEWTRRNPITIMQTIFVFRQVATGLAFAHERGIIHRDIKPANIVLTFAEASKPPLVKLVDFGIAKLAAENQGLTKEGEVFGSPLYMSPEQASGLKVDQRSDIYSLGCALYETLTGFPPFKGKSAVETMMMHLDKMAVPIERARPEVNYPSGLSVVVQKCMAKKADERYSDAWQLAQNLFQIEQGRGAEVASRLEGENFSHVVGSRFNSGVVSSVESWHGEAAAESNSHSNSDLQEMDLFLREPSEEECDAEEEVREAKSPRSKIFLIVSGMMGLLLLGGWLFEMRKTPEERERDSCKKLYSQIDHFRLTEEDLKKLALREPPQKGQDYYLFPMHEQDTLGTIVIAPVTTDVTKTDYYPASGLVHIPSRPWGLWLVLSHRLVLNPSLFQRFAKGEVYAVNFPEKKSANVAANSHLKDDPRVTNNLLVKLHERFPAIRILEVADASFDDQCLQSLSKFTNLEHLSLNVSQLAPSSSLKNLTCLKKLITLALPSSGDTSSVLEGLAKAGVVQELSVVRFQGDSKELAALGKLEKLRKFSCKQSHVSVELLERLSALPNLEYLNVAGSYVIPAAEPEFMKMKNLSTLILPNDISDHWPEDVFDDFQRRKKSFQVESGDSGIGVFPPGYVKKKKTQIKFDKTGSLEQR